MTNNEIDVRLLKYIPKALRNNVTSCDRFDRFPTGYGYNIIFDFAEDTTIFADSVDGLKWACREVLNGRRGEIYG
jgi:hypothetical protein